MQYMFPYKNILFILCNLFLLYLIGYSIYLFFSTILKIFQMYQIQRQQRLKNKLHHEYYIPISILLYTYNNQKQIVKKIKSLLKLHYKLYEIVIIDDGSSDKTIKNLKEAFPFQKIEKPIHQALQTKKIKELYQADVQNISITLAIKEHAGCADAFNLGINLSNYPYFVCINTCYTLRKDALENLIRPTLENDNVSVCLGDIIVGSFEKNIYQFPTTIFAKGQVTEYNNANLYANQISFSSLALFKKDIVISSLGYDYHDIGNNFELIEKIKEYCRLQNIPYITKKALHATAFLEVSKSVSSLMSQRRNFYHSLFTYTSKYKYIFPLLKFIGLFATILSIILHIVPTGLVFLFLVSYLLFCSFLSLCNFITTLLFENIPISFSTFIHTIFCGFIEHTFLKFFTFISILFSFIKKD